MIDPTWPHTTKAQHWGRWLGRLPGVAAIWWSGSIVRGQGTPASDIDLFFVARPGRLCTARWWVTGCLRLLGQLARPHDHAGKLCPNHFIALPHLNIIETDPYAAQLFSHCVPLSDPHGIWAHWVTANRPWVESHGYAFQVPASAPAALPAWRRTRLGNWVESLLRRLQVWQLDRHRSHLPRGAKVWITDTEIRLHPQPKNQPHPPQP